MNFVFTNNSIDNQFMLVNTSQQCWTAKMKISIYTSRMLCYNRLTYKNIKIFYEVHDEYR